MPRRVDLFPRAQSSFGVGAPFECFQRSNDGQAREPRTVRLVRKSKKESGPQFLELISGPGGVANTAKGAESLEHDDEGSAIHSNRVAMHLLQQVVDAIDVSGHCGMVPYKQGIRTGVGGDWGIILQLFQLPILLLMLQEPSLMSEMQSHCSTVAPAVHEESMTRRW